MEGFITRAFLCKHNHDEFDEFIVYGGKRKKLILYVIKYNVIDNITPHIVSYKEDIEDKVAIAITCGIVGCGILFKDPDDINEGVIFKQVDTFILSKEDFEALLGFKDTGYEIN